ncbi:MAG: nucleotide sugar dehydrogenase [Candidatus Altiarchaeales archaeon HGW-Altiarchaeales-1]|nr:MAG: nucleotide sugar dehydrogenase [Candidatus Altiarchaeales archaeon HGW-Altiarchaeales-1]
MKDTGIKIAVYGQGKMGLPLAQVIAQYYKVIGVDINKNLTENLNKGINPINDEPMLTELLEKNLKSKNYEATTDFEYAAQNSNIHIILVPTLIKENKPDLGLVKDVAKKISDGLKKNDIIITECTMPPGSTEMLIPILEESGSKYIADFGLAHCPERTMTGTAIRDITGQYPKIIGVSDERTLNVIKEIYEKINNKGVIVMSSIVAAEMVKVFEGCYRDVNIALANELSYVCEKYKVNSEEIFNAANSQPYCHIHKPGYVGGHCIPYYPWFVIDENTELMRTARKVNENVIDRVIIKVIEGLNECNVAIKNSNILILGLTFRGNVYEFAHTPAKPFIEKLKKFNPKIYAYDPLCKKDDYEKFGVKFKDIDNFRDIDCVVILADHKEFYKIDWNKAGREMRNKVIVDIRGIIDESKAKLSVLKL